MPTMFTSRYSVKTHERSPVATLNSFPSAGSAGASTLKSSAPRNTPKPSVRRSGRLERSISRPANVPAASEATLENDPIDHHARANERKVHERIQERCARGIGARGALRFQREAQENHTERGTGDGEE